MTEEQREQEHGILAPGYRLPVATRLGRVSLQVSELERSLAYYEGVLGLRALASGAGSAMLGAPGSEAPLVELRERKGARGVSRRGQLGLYHFAILLPDRLALGRFAAHLGRVGAAFGASDHRVSEALYLRDPDGLGIEVYADRPRGSWSYERRQLVMSTDPLNLGGLVSAAAGESWSGMPPGSTIGHVHLHVGELSRAADFYHGALGFDQVVWSYPGALFLSAGGYHHHLGLNTWAGEGAAPAARDDARLLHWEIVLPAADDVEEAARSLAAAGYLVGSEGDARAASDPWGTELRLRAG